LRGRDLLDAIDRGGITAAVGRNVARKAVGYLSGPPAVSGDDRVDERVARWCDTDSRRGRERVVQDGGFERIPSHDRVLEEGFDRHNGSWSCIAEVYVIAERVA
jgi:hypothetical protein